MWERLNVASLFYYWWNQCVLQSVRGSYSHFASHINLVIVWNYGESGHIARSSYTGCRWQWTHWTRLWIHLRTPVNRQSKSTRQMRDQHSPKQHAPYMTLQWHSLRMSLQAVHTFFIPEKSTSGICRTEFIHDFGDNPDVLLILNFPPN